MDWGSTLLIEVSHNGSEYTHLGMQVNFEVVLSEFQVSSTLAVFADNFQSSDYFLAYQVTY